MSDEPRIIHPWSKRCSPLDLLGKRNEMPKDFNFLPNLAGWDCDVTTTQHVEEF